MKVLLINGSPRIGGNTTDALLEMEKVFHAEGIETVTLQIGNRDIRGCIACNKCNELGRCVFDDAGKKITLYYVGELTQGALKAELKKKLPRYMIPHSLQQLEAMPLTPNGKLDRNLLKQRSKENG